MNASILRAVLALALLLGTGVIVNVLGTHAGRGPGANHVGAPAPAVGEPASGQADRADELARLRDAVERELVGRGYLSSDPDAGGPVRTRAAILAFEFDYNLPLTAQPSDHILKALIFTHARTTGQRPVAPVTDEAVTLIEEVQRALSHLGYADNKITAQLDIATQRAIRQFERARGLQDSGRVSAPLIDSLGPAFDRGRIENAGAKAVRPAG